MKRMERIENLNVRGFCAQGIVSADCIIPASPLSWSRRRSVSRRPLLGELQNFCNTSCRAARPKFAITASSAHPANSNSNAPDSCSLPIPDRVKPTRVLCQVDDHENDLSQGTAHFAVSAFSCFFKLSLRNGVIHHESRAASPGPVSHFSRSLQCAPTPTCLFNSLSRVFMPSIASTSSPLHRRFRS